MDGPTDGPIGAMPATGTGSNAGHRHGLLHERMRYFCVCANYAIGLEFRFRNGTHLISEAEADIIK